MSQSTTRFGQRVRRARVTSRCTSPPERSAARIVPRQSATRPRGSTRVRRLAIGRTGSSSRAIARRAAACSAADICSKSIRFSFSSAEKVSRASTSISSPSASSRRFGASAPSTSASAARRSAALGSGAALTPRTIGDQQLHHVLDELRIPPEQPEHLRKDNPMLRTADEAGLERVVEIPLVAEPRRLDRPDRVHHPPGPDRHSRLAQRPGEMRDVQRQLAVARERQVGIPRHALAPPDPAEVRVAEARRHFRPKPSARSTPIWSAQSAATSAAVRLSETSQHAGDEPGDRHKYGRRCRPPRRRAAPAYSPRG